MIIIEKMIEEAKIEGEESAYARAVKGIMNKNNVSFEEAADTAQVPPEQRPAIRTRMGL